MTLVSQMVPPVISSGAGVAPSVPLTSPTTRFAADQALARLMRLAAVRLSPRSTIDSRSIRRGFSTVTSTKITPSSTGSSQVGRNSTSRPGSGICRQIAAARARTTCQRGSPRVTRRHAGTTARRASGTTPRLPVSVARSSSVMRWCS